MRDVPTFTLAGEGLELSLRTAMKPAEIVSIKLIDVKSSNEILLKPKENSRCDFAEVVLGDYKIQFRLDWGDIRNGEPVLDTDILIISTNVWLPKSDPSHHTEKKYDPSTQTYTYKYASQELEWHFILKKTVQQDIPSNSEIVNPDL